MMTPSWSICRLGESRGHFSLFSENTHVAVVVKTTGFWLGGEFTTHFRTFFSGWIGSRLALGQNHYGIPFWGPGAPPILEPISVVGLVDVHWGMNRNLDFEQAMAIGR